MSLKRLIHYHKLILIPEWKILTTKLFQWYFNWLSNGPSCSDQGRFRIKKFNAAILLATELLNLKRWKNGRKNTAAVNWRNDEMKLSLYFKTMKMILLLDYYFLPFGFPEHPLVVNFLKKCINMLHYVLPSFSYL